MDEQLRKAYQTVILRHNKSPLNHGPTPGATHTCEARSRACGDIVHLHLRIAEGQIAEAGFTEQAASIGKASASILTDHVKGLTMPEAEALAEGVLEALTGDAEGVAMAGDLAALLIVRDYPSRVRSAALPWRALLGALAGRSEIDVS